MTDPSPPRVSLYRGKFLELAAISHWEFVVKAIAFAEPCPSAIVALTDDAPHHPYFAIPGSPWAKRCVEIPAGLVGDSPVAAGQPPEDWRVAALRELREEETGYALPTDVEPWLMEGPTSAGLTSECIKLVRATGLRKIGAPMPDGDEQITVHEIPLAEVDAFLAARVHAGDLIDPKVYAGPLFSQSVNATVGSRRSIVFEPKNP